MLTFFTTSFTKFNRLLICRVLALLYVTLHFWLWWQPSVNLVFYFITLALAFFVSTVIPLKKRTIILAFVTPFIIRFFVWLVEVLFYSQYPLLLATFDLSFVPSIVVAMGLFIGNVAFRLFPKYRPFEPLVRLCFFILAFWAMAEYKLFFYDHYSKLIILLGLYLCVECSCFIFATNPTVSKKSYGFTLLLVALPLLLFPWLFSTLSINMVQYKGGLLEPTLSSFDFSTSLQLQNEINLDNDLILLLKTMPPLSQKTLFKRYTLAGYNNQKGFYQVEGYGDIDYLPVTAVQVENVSTEHRTLLQQEVYLINLEEKALVAANVVKNIVPYQKIKESSFKKVYKAESWLVDNQLDLVSYPVGVLSNQELKMYLTTGDNQAIEQLAHSITDDLPTPYLKAQAINSFLKDNYLYSLKIGNPTNNEPLDYFLFESKKGYCSYFAYSMALMLRYLGIPTRVATGFWADANLFKGGYYPVTANLAHAWVEVYFDEIGWVNFDPTSDRLDSAELGNSLNDPPHNLDSLINEANQAQLLPSPANNGPLPFSLPLPPLERETLSITMRVGIGVMVILGCLMLYCCFISFLRYSLLPQKADNSLVKALKWLKAIYFYGYLKGDWLNFELFLQNNTELSRLYRKARYSQNFTTDDTKQVEVLYQAFIKNYKKITLIKRLQWFFSLHQITVLGWLGVFKWQKYR